jgi:prenyltransferase beta subunit
MMHNGNLPENTDTNHYKYQLVTLLKKVEVMQTILEIMENNMLKWYGHVLHMEDTRWHK